MEEVEFSQRYLMRNFTRIEMKYMKDTKEDEDAKNQALADADKPLCETSNSILSNSIKGRLLPTPPSWDWRTNGAVTYVKT